jgi:perosamine synthetase
MIPIYIPRVFKESANQAIESGWISSQGPFIEKAATLLKSKIDMPYVVLLNNGTSATHMLIKALKFKYPTISKIYAPNNVFVAVWNTILYEYDKNIIEILDMDPKTLNMRTDEEYIISLDKDAAVMIVHNIGNIVNVPRLKRLRPDLIFIEDNCEGLFGKYEGIYSGTSEASLCSAVSFFANKTITSGEGGAFFTRDKEVYEFIHCSVNHGLSGKKYIYKELGHNYRMTNIQAALLYDQLLNVDGIISDKKRVFERYTKNLKDAVVFPSYEKDTECSNWMMVCGLSKPYETVEKVMISCNIDIRPFFYDIQVHSHLNDIKRVVFETEYTFFMLPSFPDLTNEQIDYISTCLCNIV